MRPESWIEIGENGRNAIATVSYVVRSTCRVRILAVLCESGTATRDELRARTDVVRTTLKRNIDGLAERGMLRERDRTYELTPIGSLVASGLFDALDDARLGVRLRPVLERLPTDELDVDVERFRDATVYESTAANPYRPVERHARRLRETDHARLALPTTGARAIEGSLEGVDEDTVHEVVATPAVVETIRSNPAIAEHLESLSEVADVRYYVHDGSIPFYLGVLDETVEIGVHDEKGVPTALLESTDPAVREWATERFEEYRERSSLLE